MSDSRSSTCELKEYGSRLKPTDGLLRTEIGRSWRNWTSHFSCASAIQTSVHARRTLIAKYFEPHERAELYNLLRLDVPPDDIVAADATRFLRSDESEVKRDAKFSIRVLPAYDYTCALTRYRMIAIDGTTPLDAAHIHQFKKGGNNHPTNGIALSKTAHWLFDHGFWSITDELRVIVAEQLFEEAGEDAYLLKKLAGRELLHPTNPHFWPDPSLPGLDRKQHGFEPK